MPSAISSSSPYPITLELFCTPPTGLYRNRLRWSIRIGGNVSRKACFDAPVWKSGRVSGRVRFSRASSTVLTLSGWWVSARPNEQYGTHLDVQLQTLVWLERDRVLL